MRSVWTVRNTQHGRHWGCKCASQCDSSVIPFKWWQQLRQAQQEGIARGDIWWGIHSTHSKPWQCDSSMIWSKFSDDFKIRQAQQEGFARRGGGEVEIECSTWPSANLFCSVDFIISGDINDERNGKQMKLMTSMMTSQICKGKPNC